MFYVICNSKVYGVFNSESKADYTARLCGGHGYYTTEAEATAYERQIIAEYKAKQ